MGRAKLRMELIAKEKTRNTTYHKRKDGMIKKANEFTILCDVDTVIIIYPPNSDQAVIWPENPEKIKKTITSYKSKKGETGKKSYDLNDFLEDRMKKMEDELAKARRRNVEAKYPTWFDDLNGLNELQLRQFAMNLEIKENVVRANLEFKKRNMNNIQMPLMFEVENKQPMVHYQGFDHGQVMNHYGHGQWVNEAPMGSLMREPPVEFGYPVYDGGVVYDNNLNPNQWAFQGPVVHGGVMQEFARLEHDQLQVNNGVGDFVTDDHLGRFMGN